MAPIDEPTPEALAANPWSSERSLAAFLDLFGHGDRERNIWRVDPAWVRDHYGADADLVLDTIPPHSNDFLIEIMLEEIVAGGPEWLVEQALSVFAFRTSMFSANAFAWTHPNGGRLVALLAGARTAMTAYAIVQRSCLAFQQRVAAERPHETTSEHLDAVVARFPELMEQPAVTFVRHLRQGWLRDGNILVSPDVAERFNEFDEEMDGKSVLHIATDAAERFFVAHELSHHLLGHTWSSEWPRIEHPAQAMLARARARFGLQLDGFSERQQMELDCDVLGFLLISGTFDDTTPSFRDWVMAVMGALVALPALEDLNAVATGASTFAAHDGSADYPPIGTRITQMVRLGDEFPGDLPPGFGGNAWGIVTQMLVFRDFLAHLRGQD